MCEWCGVQLFREKVVVGADKDTEGTEELVCLHWHYNFDGGEVCPGGRGQEI